MNDERQSSSDELEMRAAGRVAVLGSLFSSDRLPVGSSSIVFSSIVSIVSSVYCLLFIVLFV